jgi:phosphoribosylformylglycinamidine synthase
MLMVLKPEAMDKARAIFEKWELDFAEIGRLTDTGRLVLKKDGKVQADMPVEPLVSEAPVYDRPVAATPAKAPVAASALPAIEPLDALKKLLACPDLASKRWIWEQYDHLVMGRTLQRPGGDAAVVRLPDSAKGLALSTDCTPRYCFADPKAGGAQAVAESWRNLTAVGATPLAITDNMNFGNPQRPEIMGQFAGCVEGMREACLALDYPVVSGNVSLYNETNGKGIRPTPAIGGVGLLEEADRAVSLGFKSEGVAIILLGRSAGHIGQSLVLRELAGLEDGPPPPVDLAAERRHGDFVRGLIADGTLSACHDLSDGGLLIAVAEMAMAGRIGASLELPDEAKAMPLAWLFGEDQGRYLMTCKASGAEDLLARAQKAGVPALRLGQTGGDALTVAGHGSISVAELTRIHEGWLPGYMGAAS